MLRTATLHFGITIIYVRDTADLTQHLQPETTNHYDGLEKWNATMSTGSQRARREKEDVCWAMGFKTPLFHHYPNLTIYAPYFVPK